MTNEPNGEMNEIQPSEPAPLKPRRSRKASPDIRALRAFCRLIENEPQHIKYAAIAYLADRYCGIRL